MDFEVKDTGAVAVLTLPVNLSRHYAETLKIYLRRALDRTGRLIVDCEQVTAVDPDCVKILCAAYRLSRTKHKDFVVAGPSPDLFLRAAKDSYAPCAGCGIETDEGCVWRMR
ncbi:MAG: STAS domain-containing protein [Nitrospirota bacterium]|nr:STAS domain-containing protein [Nitrospirota bacterium]